MPLTEPVNATLIESVAPSIADTLLIEGVVPILFVVTDADVVELADVQAVPDNAFNATV